MIRTSTFCDKNVVAVPASNATIFNVAGGVATDVLPDSSKVASQEIAARFIQNCGANIAYFCIGQTCNGAEYHGILPPAQDIPQDISAYGLSRISVYSPNGTIISTITLRRTAAQEQGSGTITPYNP